MIIRNFIFYLFFFILIQASFSQSSFSEALEKRIDSLCIKEKNYVCQAFTFYKLREYDSCYLFLEKNISKAKKTVQKDILFYLQGKISMKKKFHKKALNSFSKISDDSFYKTNISFNIGAISIFEKKFTNALEHYSNWEKDTASISKAEKMDGYHNMGISYIHIRKYDLAEKYFNKEVLLIEETDTLKLISTKIDLANVYYNQYLDNKAIPLFKKAYDLAQTLPNLSLKRNTAKNMAVVERNRKRYKESVKYYQEYNKWKDSIWNRDKIWELTEKDKQLAVAQKQQEIALQDEQIKRQQVVQKGLLIGASGLLIFIGGLAFFYQKLKKQKRLITQQKEALDTANKTKNYLFSVVSHDLRSPINTIKRQHKKLAKHIANNDLPAIKEATQQAISVTDSTSHLLNNVLQWSLEQSNQLNFSQEDYALQPIIEHILFDYEELAESNEISIATNFTKDITVKTDKESLKIVLRNLIDNSVKYMNEAGSIAITTSIENNKARIEIKDSGIGISKEKLQKINALKDLSVDKIDRSKGLGLGLILCQTLIKKNNGTLFFESEEGKSTTAIILLPLA